jgi:hypothetical protein
LPPLPVGKFDIQELVDRTQDGRIVHIPRARYVLYKNLLLRRREDLTIRCQPGTQILVSDVKENVLTIDRCKRIEIEGAHLRHLKPLKEYECHGAVIGIKESIGVTITDCELDGCGAIGVSARDSGELTVDHCHVRNNTFTAFYPHGCDKVKITSSIIRDNGNLVQLYEIRELDMHDNVIERNGGYWEKMEAKPGPRSLKVNDEDVPRAK